MQKPDVNGYINVIWPSRTIPHGGIFHTRVSEQSSERQAFLKVLIEESKLDSELRKKSGYALRQPKEPEQPRIERPLIRPKTSRRRSLSCIRESGVFEIEPFKPLKRGEDRQKLIDKLAHTMAYGDMPAEQLGPAPTKVEKKPLKLPSKEEQWSNLVTQIRERAEWLADMEFLGQADPHRDIIKDQIAERLRAMDALGIDSQCSSARSGFSTLRSREPTKVMRGTGVAKPDSATARPQVGPCSLENASVKSQGSAVKQISAKKNGSARSSVSHQSKGSQDARSIQSSGRSGVIRKIVSNKDENVSAYGSFPPLKYSPRRRI